MNITQLTVLNACLASMGEEPINSTAEDNAFVNAAKFALEQANLDEQARGWYFNLEHVNLRPDTLNNRYHVPADIIDLVVDSTNPGWITLRGRRLYDSRNGDWLEGTSPIKLHVTRLLEFEDLPMMARRMVKAAAVVKFQQSYDGDAQKIQEAQTEYQMAYINLNSQHIRSVGANFLPRRGMETRGRHRRLPT